VREVVPYHVWTNRECPKLSELFEEAVQMPSIAQGLSLLWADETNVPAPGPRNDTEHEDELLSELDGHLQFHKRSRRR
jgi:hypothetical protein